MGSAVFKQASESGTRSRDGSRDRVVAAATGAMIAGGLLTLVGWFAGFDFLLQQRPGQGVMTVNSALSFVLLGFGISSAQALDPRIQTVAIWGLFFVLGLALLNAVQIAAGLDLHINLSSLHGRLHAGVRVPGQMAESTTAALAMASISALTLRCPPGSTSSEIGRALSALVAIIGLLALLGHLADLEWLYSWQAYGRMALPTSLCTSLAGLALWRSRGVRAPALSDERQITAISSAALIGMAAVAALISVVALRSESRALTSRSLDLDRASAARGVEALLAVAADRAALLAERPELKAAGSASQALAPLLQAPVLSTSGIGLSRLALQAPSGLLLAEAGPADVDGLIELPLTLAAPGRHALRWNGGFELRSRILLPDGDAGERTLVVTQPLPGLHEALQPLDGAAGGKTLRLCGRAVDGDSYCLQTGATRAEDRLVTPPPAVLERLQAAYRGERAAAAQPGREAGDSAALTLAGPLGESGLALLIEADPDALSGPAGHRVAYGLLVITGVAILAVLLLRARIKPLVLRMIASETRYEAVVRTLHEGLVLQAADGRIVASNPAARRILGLSEDQLHGRTSIDPRWRAVYADGRDWPGDDHPAARTLRTGQPEVDVEMGIHHTDGSLRWLRVNTAMIDQPGSEHDRSVVVSFEDATEQRNSELLSRQLEQRFRLLIDNIPDHAVFMLGPEGTVVSWSKGAEQVTGYRAEDVQGRNFSLFYTAEDRLAKRPERELMLAREAGRYSEEGWRVRKDGSRYWVAAFVSAIRDPSGQLIGYAKITRDLTERHRYEQKVADANRLRDDMLMSAPYAIIAFGLDGVITAFNPAAERMLWYRAEELIGRATPELLHDGRELAERAAEMSAELGLAIGPGLEVLMHRPRLGITEEREWLFVRKDGSRFPVNLAISAMRDSDEQVTGFFGVAYDITERKRREEYTRHVAHHDFLTGLPNRLLLNDRLEMALQRARRSGEQVAVLMLDLDHFKRVNDSLGHHVGDELLKVAAERITACVRTIDTVARMGGDEFVIVLGQLEDTRDAEAVAAKIVEAVALPVQIGMHELTVTPSLGISIFPDDGDAPGMLLKHADSAMYRMKAAGRRGYRTFNSEMARLSQERLEIESALRHALRHDEFRVYYQPQIALDSGAVCGMEALLRWQDPARGPVLPERFIEVAEESGLIGPVGEWVLRTACREARELQRATGQLLRLAVNLSPRQFRQEELLGIVASALGDSGLAPECLELEITEGVLMADTEETIERLQAIRALGVSIAIDDFGVGFSSLSYITRFHVDTLKIDRSFVSKLPGSANDAAVAQAIIALGRSLNLTVVAEGVETPEQLEFLRGRRCDAAQGTLIGDAAPAASLNIQGHCIGEAMSADAFAAGFEGLKARSLGSVPHAA